MNVKRLIFIGTLIASIAAIAAPPKNLKPGDGVYGKDGKKLTREEVRAILYRRNGGKLKVPGVQKGSVNYVICNNAVNFDWVQRNAQAFERVAKIEIGVVNGSFDFSNPKILGNASLFIVDNPQLPSLLIAPEQKWALVNVAPLKKGRGEKPAFFEARVQKELTRGFAMLCGATSSNYPQSLTGCVTTPNDLDKFPDCVLPVDVTARFEEYLKGYGVVPYKLKTYRQACQEGWAPAPTNDIQKAIWDKVRATPKNPMKIEFDPKKGR